MAANAPVIHGNVLNPNQAILDEIALIPAGPLRMAFDNTRNRLVALAGFNGIAGGGLDGFLVGTGAIYSSPTQLAGSSPSDIAAIIKDHNKAHPGFATAINSQKALFLQGYAQMWRGYSYGGMPMDPIVLTNGILLTTRIMVDGVYERLQFLLSLEKQVVGTATIIKVGIYFNGWLLGLRTILSGIVGAFWETIVYLTCPSIIHPTNRQHVDWNRVPKFGPKCNSDKRRLFRILEPCIANSLYSNYLVGYAPDQDGRGLLLEIMQMEHSDGNQINHLKILKRSRDAIYTGKNIQVYGSSSSIAASTRCIRP